MLDIIIYINLFSPSNPVLGVFMLTLQERRWKLREVATGAVRSQPGWTGSSGTKFITFFHQPFAQILTSLCQPANPKRTSEVPLLKGRP